MSERTRDRTGERDGDRRATTGPFGTLLGATFGPVGAAVGSVVDETRLAFTFSFGTGASRPRARRDERGAGLDFGLDDAATIEVEDPSEVDGGQPDDALVDDGSETENAENAENDENGEAAGTGGDAA